MIKMLAVCIHNSDHRNKTKNFFSSYSAIKDEPESFGDSESDKSLLHWNLCGRSGPWSLNDLSLLPCWYLRQKRRWQDPTFSFMWPQLGKYIFLFHKDKFRAIHLLSCTLHTSFYIIAVWVLLRKAGLLMHPAITITTTTITTANT